MWSAGKKMFKKKKIQKFRPKSPVPESGANSGENKARRAGGGAGRGGGDAPVAWPSPGTLCTATAGCERPPGGAGAWVGLGGAWAARDGTPGGRGVERARLCAPFARRGTDSEPPPVFAARPPARGGGRGASSRARAGSCPPPKKNPPLPGSALEGFCIGWGAAGCEQPPFLPARPPLRSHGLGNGSQGIIKDTGCCSEFPPP